MTLPSLHRLRVFAAIADAGSVSAGARALGITQSTASTHLRQLETEVGSLLIERTGKQFRPTEAGTVLLGYAQRMIAIADEAVDDLAGISLRPLTGALTVGATTTTTEGRFLPTALHRFAAAYPEVTLDLRVDNSTTLLRSVLDGVVGVAIIAADVDDPALTVMALAPEDQTVIVSGNHPLAGSHVDTRVLRDSVVLLREQGSATRTYQEQLLSRWRIPGARTWTLASTSAIIGAVAAGLGLSCLPRVACRDALALGRIAELTLDPPPPARPVCLVRRTDHHLTRAEEHFLTLITESQQP
ncbi:LysR family transcriptional regulator [Mycolicibacterium mengxianglii]|uniref:LysR family transcriptional regulator n=1 Tax=Mycolicibacterium mengxianglii TaxID=2736649 RepID=UPI0018D15159|nr:LysR family transcriptional regulator [Mycolicibacterium mengxianglii]